MHHTVTAVGVHMSQFMSQDKRVLAAFVHACWMLRSSSIGLADVDLESDIDIDSDELLEVPLADILNG